MDYLWSYPKGNTVRCEYKENFFDMSSFWGELSSVFIKMKNGIRKPEDRASAGEQPMCRAQHKPGSACVLIFLPLHFSVISI